MDESRTNKEFFKHVERKDGTRHLFFGPQGSSEHGHAVIDPNGNVRYLRESDGCIIANDQQRNENSKH